MRWLARLAFGVSCAATGASAAQPRSPHVPAVYEVAHRLAGDLKALHAFQPPRTEPDAAAQPLQPYIDRDWSDVAGVQPLGLGAMATVGLGRDGRTLARLKAMGVADGAALADQGRWYLFAAASGRAVGLNILAVDTGWGQGGWTTDPTSTLVGDAQLGVGWRKGAMQTSFGYLHREVKGRHMIFGQGGRNDDMVGLTLSLKSDR